MNRLLKSTATDPAPGESFAIQKQKSSVDVFSASEQFNSPAEALGLSAKGYEHLPLRQAFELQKINNAFQQNFSLESTELICQEIPATCALSGTVLNLTGTLYLSKTFLCFTSTQKYQCNLSLPFYAVMRVEKINAQIATIAITARHSLKLLFGLNADKPSSDAFCAGLRDRLQENVNNMKGLKSFLATCSSEDLVSGKESERVSGLGATFGYVEAKKYNVVDNLLM